MSQKELEQLIKAYEARKRSEILLLINRINRLFGKSFKDVHSLMKAARLINKRSLDPLTKSRIENIVDELYSKITDETERVVLNAGKLSARFQYSIEKDLFKRLKVPSLISFRNGSTTAAKTVLNDKTFGRKFSDRIWKQHKNYRKRIENVVVDGLKNGYSAKSMAKDLVNAEYKNASGPGVYKDPRKNAERLTRSTINQAYQKADHERWKDAWYIKCIEVRLSNAHPVYDICDVLATRYPKDFKFIGWHPQCYSFDTEVYTRNGWKLFKDVELDEDIMTIRRDNQKMEWHPCVATVKKPYKGKMIRFNNRSLDMLVTPDHPMVMLNDEGGNLYSNKDASSIKTGTIYRAINGYDGRDLKYISFGESNRRFDFLTWCEFMGYYLSDGSVVFNGTHESQIHIAQSIDHDPNNYKKIVECIQQSPFEAKLAKNGIYIFDKDFANYLRDFGKCNEKFIPEQILNASPVAIRRFLDSYLSCDGHERKPKPFVGSRGSLCVPKTGGKTYYTTSERMAGEIGEMILKVGGRPSFSIGSEKGKKQKFKNGEYTINHNLYRIHELTSKTATVWSKSEVDYDNFVYDIEVAANNTLYVRRNGKCNWGSNCLCVAVPILVSEKERDLYEDYALGLRDTPPKVRYVTKTPAGFDMWMEKNKERVAGWKNEPEWITANQQYIKK